MKTWLIKLGKAWAVLRQDGVWRGLKRIHGALLASVQPIGTGDILFVSSGTGDSARYRTRHVAEELALQGFRVATTVQDHPDLMAAASRFQVFVFHRPLVTERLRRCIEQLKALKKTIIFETDDLVYDPAFLVHMDYYRRMNALEREQYKHGVGGEILNDSSVETVTTTTSFLAAKLRERGKQVLVVPNRLSQEDVRWAEEAAANQQKTLRTTPEIRIGYFSGTPSHNKDFATITEALLGILARYPSVRLVLAGPLDIDPAFGAYHERIERLPYVDRQTLFHRLASLDINLAPLEVGNPFCEAKSELKFFEAGIVGVPTVAATTQTFRDAIHDGVDGFLAARTEEWQEKLGRLIEDEAFRTAMGKKARHTALERFTTASANNEAYYKYLRDKLTV